MFGPTLRNPRRRLGDEQVPATVPRGYSRTRKADAAAAEIAKYVDDVARENGFRVKLDFEGRVWQLEPLDVDTKQGEAIAAYTGLSLRQPGTGHCSTPTAWRGASRSGACTG